MDICKYKINGANPDFLKPKAQTVWRCSIIPTIKAHRIAQRIPCIYTIHTQSLYYTTLSPILSYSIPISLRPEPQPNLMGRVTDPKRVHRV